MREISLNASMRSNLLSLQQTQMLQDMTQLRLSTGLKVNSAIDNPSSYYTASSLNNRAQDLSQLLDAMGQGIQTIKTASETLVTATKFLEQAKAVATKASEASFDIVAKVRNEKELLDAIKSGRSGFIVIEKDIEITNAKIVLKNNQSLVGANYFDASKKQTTLSFDYDNFSADSIRIGDNATIANLNFKVNNKYLDYMSQGGVIEYSTLKLDNVSGVTLKNLNFDTDTSGYIGPGRGYNAIRSENSKYKIEGTINVSTVGVNNRFIINSNNTVLNINDALINGNSKDSGGMGLQSYYNSVVNINGSSKINLSAGVGIMIYRGATINVNDHSEVNILSSSLISGSTIMMEDNKFVINDHAKVNISGTTNVGYTHLILNSADASLNLATTNVGHEFFGSYISAVNGAKISTKMGEFTCNIAGGVQNILLSATSDMPAAYFSKDASKPATMPANIKDRLTNLVDYMAAHSDFDSQKNIEKVDSFTQYNSIFSQYNLLINDGGYKGINLLEGASLKVNFNEERSSQVEVKGVDASIKGLGIGNNKWESQNDVQKSLEELESAINKIREYSSQFGNYYSIVSSRQDFTENLINVLTEGSDKLTLADMNEESANILALKTRQQLAINSLSLASQATQSVLNLF